MFKLGRDIRESYKTKCLKIDPTLKCKRRIFGSLGGFVVLKDGKGIASSRTAEDAWCRVYQQLSK